MCDGGEKSSQNESQKKRKQISGILVYPNIEKSSCVDRALVLPEQFATCNLLAFVRECS